MGSFSAEANGMRTWASLVFAALGVSVAAMVALHVFQPELDPLTQPVSFYVWGRQGWLLPLALVALGVALLGLARSPAASFPPQLRRKLSLTGTLLLVTAVIPSDRWFPWEHRPSISGLLHAAAAMIAPLLLAWVMLASSNTPTAQRWLRGAALAYACALTGSATSLALGFLRDGPPPGIGLMERVLAVAAATWTAVFACQIHRTKSARPA